MDEIGEEFSEHKQIVKSFLSNFGMYLNESLCSIIKSMLELESLNGFYEFK
jgi:hypothetical protein